jgi:small subunit ribosomal protein S6
MNLLIKLERNATRSHHLIERNPTFSKFFSKNTYFITGIIYTFAPAFQKAFIIIHNSLIMRHYEVTFIVDPVLSGDEVTSTAQTIQEDLKRYGTSIIAVDTMGLRQLAYPINKRSSGVYYCVEFACEVADFLGKFELSLKRNEKLLRFLTVKLDKYGVKYNEDKRNGLIGSRKKVAPAPVKKADDLDEVVLLAPEVVDLDAPEVI